MGGLTFRDPPWEPVEPGPLGVDLDHLVRLRESDDQSWKKDAACKGMTALFWPPRGANEIADRARAICATCPVAMECLAFGLYEREGIWGGLSVKPRRRIARAVRASHRRVRVCGTRSAYQGGCRCDDCRAANTAYLRMLRGAVA